MLRELTQKDIYSIEMIQRYAIGHFFDRDTMRFFGSRLSQDIYHGQGVVYFVTSERRGQNPRGHTVRLFDLATRSIKSVSEFNVLSRYKAHAMAKELSQNETNLKKAV